MNIVYIWKRRKSQAVVPNVVAVGVLASALRHDALPLLHGAELVEQERGTDLHEVPRLLLLVLLPQL